MPLTNKTGSTEDSVGSFAGKKVWITGHKGMLGSAVVRNFADEGANLLLTSRAELDLTDQAAVLAWMERKRPELVFHIGAKVGGIHANATMPADFLLDNLMIQSNVINGAYRFGVQKLVFVATNCTYPTNAPQPISEDALLTGPPYYTIPSTGVSTAATIVMRRAYRQTYGINFISVIPPNLYGPGDNYPPQTTPGVAGILRRPHEAKLAGKSEFVVWGDGTARREILHVDDLADAMKCVMQAPITRDLYNIGCDHDLAISELATIIAEVVGFPGKIVYDTSKPNGTMRKLLNSSRVRSLGWRPKIGEKAGLRSAYADLLNLLRTPELGSRL